MDAATLHFFLFTPHPTRTYVTKNINTTATAIASRSFSDNHFLQNVCFLLLLERVSHPPSLCTQSHNSLSLSLSHTHLEDHKHKHLKLGFVYHLDHKRNLYIVCLYLSAFSETIVVLLQCFSIYPYLV